MCTRVFSPTQSANECSSPLRGGPCSDYGACHWEVRNFLFGQIYHLQLKTRSNFIQDKPDNYFLQDFTVNASSSIGTISIKYKRNSRHFFINNHLIWYFFVDNGDYGNVYCRFILLADFKDILNTIMGLFLYCMFEYIAVYHSPSKDVFSIQGDHPLKKEMSKIHVY